jgi:hypothetical protein
MGCYLVGDGLRIIETHDPASVSHADEPPTHTSANRRKSPTK